MNITVGVNCSSSFPLSLALINLRQLRSAIIRNARPTYTWQKVGELEQLSHRVWEKWNLTKGDRNLWSIILIYLPSTVAQLNMPKCITDRNNKTWPNGPSKKAARRRYNGLLVYSLLKRGLLQMHFHSLTFPLVYKLIILFIIVWGC